jgi:hypothetical protein
LCWQTVEQQFNPALAIASAVRHKIIEIKLIIMRLIFRIYCILFLGILLFNCKKNKEDIPVKYFKTIIELTNDYKILTVTGYEGEYLKYHKYYLYSAGSVQVTQTDNNNNIMSKSRYFLNSMGLADSCIDSTYHNLKLSNIDLSKLSYDDNGYKTTSTYILKNISADTISSISTISLHYNTINGNLSEVTINGGVVAYYDYSSQENKIDLFSFLGNFNGKINANLMKKYSYGVHGTPSTQPESTEYSYILNSNGLVIECDALYTSSYHTSDSSPSHEKRITKYEYIFQ